MESSNKVHLDHQQVLERAFRAVECMKVDRTKLNLYPIPRGGVPAVYAMQAAHPFPINIMPTPEGADYAVDDIIDSGATAEEMMREYNLATIALVDKRDELMGVWVVFPWEIADENDGPERNVVRLIEWMGDDPTRDGLRETPGRFLRALKYWGRGYVDTDLDLLLKTFGSTWDQMVVVDRIPFHSLCEHHMAPFTGVARIAYIPNGKIVGLSKLPRLLEHFAARLQVQEHLTEQVANAIMEHLSPLGCGVRIEASHSCMSSRGVKVHGTITRTVAVRGAFKKNPETRAEFLA